jgi:hypothetical protein
MRVFVLGAGVSKPAGFPLAKELMQVVREYLEQNRTGPYETLADTWDSLLRKRIFRTDDDAELNFTRLHLHMRGILADARAGRRVRTDGSIGLYENLPRIINDRFVNRHLELARDPDRWEYLRHFVRRHVRPGDAIVTLNYDVLAELALRAEERWGLRNGYGLDLAPYYPELASQLDPTQDEVLKLHGSVGWLRVLERLRRGFRMGFPGQREDAELLVQREVLGLLGHGDLQARYPEQQRVLRSESVVIPTYLKYVSAFPLPAIWKRASDLLQSAERVIFCGYSLAVEDAAVRTLFLASIPRGGRVDFYYYQMDPNAVREIKDLFTDADVIFRNRQASIEELAETDRLPLDEEDQSPGGSRLL